MNFNIKRVFSNQLCEQNQLVIVFGQVINSSKITPQQYCLTITDNFGNLEFWWHHDISIGIYVEVFGTYQQKIYNDIKFNKIYAKRIKIFESSNNYMLCFLETIFEQKKEQQQEQQQQFTKQIQVIEHSKELTTEIAVYYLKLIGGKYLKNAEIKDDYLVNFKGEEFEDMIYSKEELKMSIQILQSVGIFNGNVVCKQEFFNIINLVKSILSDGKALKIKECTKKINDYYLFKGYQLFTDEISVCIFNLFLLNYMCIQDSSNTIMIRK
ncbi:unnamed protein product [Paramecium pentaurelia]|uniref:Uncharacterized protein n=1 Tax=Paramecium pentaurelia TaxID=43138 RepID=A0A8S1X687_9CILI|nr:unnamed protein product [Paramecium pentaurelia]